MMMSYNKAFFACLFLYSCAVFAQIPVENAYKVILRSYAVEPEPQKFTISGHDQAFLTKPAMAAYTQLNPVDPKALYTIPPYPHTEFLPKFGKWMTVMDLDSQPTYLLSETDLKQSTAKPTLVPAHWVSLTNTRGQYIIEPINYVFIVHASQNKQPLDLLHTALRKAGFTGTATQNHSGGYSAYIGDQLLGQLTTPHGGALTYSNRDFQVQNDHFRIFGAYRVTINKKVAMLYTASLSEESGLESNLAALSPEKLQIKLDELKKQNHQGEYYKNYGHHFVSFAGARNNLAVGLIKAGYPTYYASMGNIVNTLGESTEDHDGNVYLTVVSD